MARTTSDAPATGTLAGSETPKVVRLGSARGGWFRQSDSSPADWNNGWGKQYFWPEQWSHAKVYARVPVSLKLGAASRDQRAAAIQELRRFRAPSRLKGTPL